MKIINDSCCNLCSLKAQGTYIHMFWGCPPVRSFENSIAAKLSDLTQETVPVTIRTLILDDLSVLNVSKLKKTTQSWVLSLLDVIYMELSAARINGADDSTLSTWHSAAEALKNMV